MTDLVEGGPPAPGWNSGWSGSLVISMPESQDGVAGPPAVACTLSAGEQSERAAAWRRLLGSGLVERARVPRGLRLRARVGSEAELMALIDLERECCSWIHFEVVGGSEVELTAPGEAETVLAGMFQAG